MKQGRRAVFSSFILHPSSFILPKGEADVFGTILFRMILWELYKVFVLALIGILVRNSVILIVQIEDLRKEGRPAWDAVVEATEHRMRPIMLTAAAASLALIPIAREIFWGPMAYAMMGGIIVGTVLTLLFLPALYVAWFRIKAPEPATDDNHEIPTAPELQTDLCHREMEHA